MNDTGREALEIGQRAPYIRHSNTHMALCVVDLQDDLRPRRILSLRGRMCVVRTVEYNIDRHTSYLFLRLHLRLRL